MLPSAEEFDVAAVARGGLLEFLKRAWHVVRPTDVLSVNWHHGVMCRAFEALLREEEAAEKGVVNVPPGSAQPHSEPVLLERGWTPMGEVRPGDRIYGSDGGLHTVLQIHPQGVRDVWEVEFSDGATVRCDGGHLWTFDRADPRVGRAKTRSGVRVTQTAEEWANTRLQKQDGKFQRRLFYCPMPEAIQYSEAELPIDPYTLGLILGDGSLTTKTPSFASADGLEDQMILPAGVVLNKFTKKGTHCLNVSLSTGTREGGADRNLLTVALRGLGLMGTRSHDKFIPSIYLRSSPAQRLAVLQGLMDTDGTISGSSGVFGSASIELALGVKEIVESLGGTSTYSVHKTSYTHKGEKKAGLPLHMLRLRLPNNQTPFRMARKVALFESKAHQRNARRAVVAIRKTAQTELCTCITVSAPDSLYVTKYHVLTHNSKSLLTSVFLPAFAWGPGGRPDWRVGYGSFDVNLSFRDSGLCKDLIRSEWYQRRWGFKADPEMLKRYGLTPATAGQENSALTDSASIWYTSGGGLRFATSTGSKATGWHFHAFFVDDPTKPDTIKNGGDQAREALKGTQNWWTQTISSRRVNPNYFGRWVIMQRLHTEDLASYAIREGYTAIVVPARHELARPCKTPWGDDPRTEEGEIFWHERFSDKGLTDLEKALGAHARAQYQQDPIPDGGSVFKPVWLQNLYRVLPAGIDQWVQSWDMSFSGKATADYVVGQVWARKGSNYYLVEQVRFRGGLPETIAAVKRMRDRFPKAIRTLIEAKANGPAVMQVLEGKLPGLVPVEPEGGKVARAHEASVYFEALNIWLPEGAEWLQDYVSEFLAFPQGANDDQVDTTTQALNHFHPGSADKLDRLYAALRS